MPVLSEPFQLHVRPRRDVVVVAPEGELDLATVGAVDAQLRELHESGFDRLVVDLRGLSFIDSSGVELLVRWTRAAHSDGHDFAVAHGGAAVERILELTHVREVLHFVDPRKISG
jgi:anti-sigma B factor antagonist